MQSSLSVNNSCAEFSAVDHKCVLPYFSGVSVITSNSAVIQSQSSLVFSSPSTVSHSSPGLSALSIYSGYDTISASTLKRVSSSNLSIKNESEDRRSRMGSYSTSRNSNKYLPGAKKTKGRVKIKMEFIDNKMRRYTTFSKRKTGIMKKAYELSTLTGTQVMLLVASETGHVYTFATKKLQPMITSETGKSLIQTCLNTPDQGTTTGSQSNTTTSVVYSSSSSCFSPDAVDSRIFGVIESAPESQTTNGVSSVSTCSVFSTSSSSSSSSSQVPSAEQSDQDRRMSITGFEEIDLSYNAAYNTVPCSVSTTLSSTIHTSICEAIDSQSKKSLDSDFVFANTTPTSYVRAWSSDALIVKSTSLSNGASSSTDDEQIYSPED